MTWRPEPQPECEPGCTCSTTAATTPVVMPASPARECGVTGCTYCREIQQWIEDTDPDPAPIDDYQEASNELHHTDYNRKASS